METPDKDDDLILLKRYTENDDREALSIFLKRQADPAYRIALRFLRNSADAEDAVQMAFIAIMRDASKFREGGSVKAWTAQIVLNTCKKLIRQNVRRRNREDIAWKETPPPDSVDEQTSELVELTRQMLDQLPEKYRLPIWLHHYEGLSFNEMATALSRQEGTLRSHVSRGLEMLRAKIASSGVSTPVTGVVAALVALPAETAPQTLLTSISDIVMQTGAFTKAALASKSYALTETTTAKIALGVTASAALAGAGLWIWLSTSHRDNAETPALSPKPAAISLQPVNYRWDFNSPDCTNNFAVLTGSMKYVPAGGEDGSGCLETGPGSSVIVIDVPAHPPLLMEYRSACVGQAPEGDFLATALWTSYGPEALFYGIGTKQHLVAPRDGQVSSWTTFRNHLADRYVDTWNGSQLTIMHVTSPSPNARVCLVLRGGHRIDNLTIRSAAVDEIPDASVYLKAVEKIPPEKRRGTVPLPDLKPGPSYREVKVRFEGDWK